MSRFGLGFGSGGEENSKVSKGVYIGLSVFIIFIIIGWISASVLG